MKLILLCVGKLKGSDLRSLSLEYEKRIGKHWALDIVEVGESDKVTENKKLREKIDGKKSFTIAFDKSGTLFTSESFSTLLQERSGGNDVVTVVIGGSEGLDDETLKVCNIRASMGKMTFPHQLARIVVLEQLYRSQEIIHGTKYHK